MPDHTLKDVIPAVHRFTTDPDISSFQSVLGRGGVRACIQRILDGARSDIRAGGPAPDETALRMRVLALLAAQRATGLVRVINGTGVILHTNLGRAPLARVALDAISQLGAGYTNLEFDLESGERGERYDRVAHLLYDVTGAQASLVVNNCAAAVLLVLDTFARGREVVVSRGQLIEIGGGFRLPDVLRKSGALLVEVGTTNKTYAADFRNAWGANTAMFMRAHPSNYRVEGFTSDVDSKSLAALAKELDVLAFEDLGSGALVDLREFGAPGEPTVAEELAAGMDLVAVSGDKLLGGPQCGIICGRADLIAQMRRNPLLRALRTDKATIAALAATLSLYATPERLREIPLFAMLSRTADELFARATRLRESIAAACAPRSARFTAVRTSAAAGGGTLPLVDLPSAGIAVEPLDRTPDRLAADLRGSEPPILGRIERERFIVDLRAVSDDEDADLTRAFAHSLRERR
jgi:L-seryl-tRNA(Ser) seleniumtransferase